MKLLTVIYDSAIHESMVELMEALSLPGITWISGVRGRGGRGRKENSPVFPGENNIALIALPLEQARQVAAAIRRLQAQYRLKPGVTILCQPIEELETTVSAQPTESDLPAQIADRNPDLKQGMEG